MLDRATGRWFLYTCRESDNRGTPQVALFNDGGRLVWGAVNRGHIDMGWAARLGEGGRPVAMAIRIGHKTCGPDGRFHQQCDEFVFDALTGAEQRLPFSVYRTIPVDFDGDGRHELVRGIAGSDGEVLDCDGRVLGSVGGPAAMASNPRIAPVNRCSRTTPTVACGSGRTARHATRTMLSPGYRHPLFTADQRLTAVGYNLVNMGRI